MQRACARHEERDRTIRTEYILDLVQLSIVLKESEKIDHYTRVYDIVSFVILSKLKRLFSRYSSDGKTSRLNEIPSISEHNTRLLFAFGNENLVLLFFSNTGEIVAMTSGRWNRYTSSPRGWFRQNRLSKWQYSRLF